MASPTVAAASSAAAHQRRRLLHDADTAPRKDHDDGVAIPRSYVERDCISCVPNRVHERRCIAEGHGYKREPSRITKGAERCQVWGKCVEQDDTWRIHARLTTGGNGWTNAKDQWGHAAESGGGVTGSGEPDLARRGFTDKGGFAAAERIPWGRWPTGDETSGETGKNRSNSHYRNACGCRTPAIQLRAVGSKARDSARWCCTSSTRTAMTTLTIALDSCSG
jgi:hypothetical protein